MERIGIFYGSTTGNCQVIADKLETELGKSNTDVFEVAYTRVADLDNYKNLIFGVSTWGTGDLQEDWNEFIGNRLILILESYFSQDLPIDSCRPDYFFNNGTRSSQP